MFTIMYTHILYTQYDIVYIGALKKAVLFYIKVDLLDTFSSEKTSWISDILAKRQLSLLRELF